LKCTFADNAKGLEYEGFGQFPSIRDFKHNVFDLNTSNMSGTGGDVSLNTGITPTGVKDWNAYAGNTETNGINTSSTPVNFNNRSNLDFSLAAASALRGAGEFGENIGASFNPRFFVDNNVFSNVLLSAGVNDEDYYDTTLDQPGPDGPVDAGPAIFAGGTVKIDNVAEPGAKSAQWHLGPYTLPAGSKARFIGYLAQVNESLASGSKEIIGVQKTNRKIYVSINGGAKVEYGKANLIDVNASTIDLYIRLRVDGEPVA
jgi:hypothetical protein